MTNIVTKTYPVAEVFGPTIQGEGELQGVSAYFVRFGGCDYRCEWCDTPHAVLPNAVKANERLSVFNVFERLQNLVDGPKWVVITGGNPALHDLEDFVHLLHSVKYNVSVETQGSKWKNWLRLCESICVSPKPPSAGMYEKNVVEHLYDFMYQLEEGDTVQPFFKVVVFNHTDYEWAVALHGLFPDVPFYLSAGNDAGKTVGNPDRVDERSDDQIRIDLISKFRWLTNRVMVDPKMADVKVQAQAHVLLWANERGR